MKRIYAVIAALVVVVAGTFFFTNQSSSTKKVAKIPTVGILQTMSHPALDQIYKGVLKGLENGGYSGKKVHIKFENAEADVSNLKSMSEKFKSDKANLTIGIATPAAQALANTANGDTPVILAGITDPVGGKLVKSESKPGNNITGTEGVAPLAQQLKLIQDVMPKAKRIGVIYTTSDHGGTYSAQQFAKLAKKAGVATKLYAISSTNDMQQVAGQMVSECDVVYAPQDNNVATAMKTLVNIANTAKVPVFTAADTMVKDGGLATYAVSQFDLGRVAGEMAAKVLKGKKTATFPVATLTEGSYTVNTAQAKKLGITIPANILKAAKKANQIVK